MRRRRWSMALPGLLAALIIASAAPVAAATPAPIGDFQLKGTYQNAKSTSLTLAPIGAPVFQTVTVAGKSRKALVFAVGDGLTLTGIPLAGRRTYTIDAWFELDSVDCYQRVLSFGPLDTDDGMYICDGGPYVYPQSSQSAPLVKANTWTHLRITRDGKTKRVQVYVNGRLSNIVLDLMNELTLRQGTVVFFKDDSGGDDSSGTVAGITVWNRVVAP